MSCKHGPLAKLGVFGTAAVALHFALDALMVGAGVSVLTHHQDEPDTVFVEVPRVPPLLSDAARLNTLTERLGGRYEIASAVLLESQRSGIPVNLIVGIMRTENAPLDADTVNWYGATGLMQVWNYHDGAYAAACGDGPLIDVRTNVCYGVEILREKLQVAGGDTLTALLLYNGCWGATFQTGCEKYPFAVMNNY